MTEFCVDGWIPASAGSAQADLEMVAHLFLTPISRTYILKQIHYYICSISDIIIILLPLVIISEIISAIFSYLWYYIISYSTHRQTQK